MSDDIVKIKWHSTDQPAADRLTPLTHGMTHTLGTSALPVRLQQLPNVTSYYASPYKNPVPAPRGIVVGGEMLVGRAAEGLNKNDQFVFGTSSNGQVCFAGPFKGFGHHVSSGQHIEVSAMFGHTPFSSKR